MTATRSDELLQLAIRSRTALDNAQSLCLRAESLTQNSTTLAIDLLASDAKAKWISEGINKQLKLVSLVANSLSTQRAKLEEDAKVWDAKRAERIASLDTVLDTLGSQLVPPEIHETASGSSLFGSQHSDAGSSENATMLPEPSSQAPNNNPSSERGKWRSLRYFVDEGAVEEALDQMDQNRTALDDLIETTSAQPQNLTSRIATIKNGLPTGSGVDVRELLRRQEHESANMAHNLESLAHHFGQMEMALNDVDSGEVIGDEDMDIFIKDTEQLPHILNEIEIGLKVVEHVSDELVAGRLRCDEQLVTHRATVRNLEEMGEVMAAMLSHQHDIEMDATNLHITLNGHLTAITELQSTYVNYNTAYQNLVLEMDRRSKYRQTMSKIVVAMAEQLRAAREEEIGQREQFSKSQAGWLPDDLCPFVTENPTIYEIQSRDQETEIDIDAGYVEEIVRKHTK